MVKIYVKCNVCGRVFKIFNESRSRQIHCICDREGFVDVEFKEITYTEYEEERYKIRVERL